MKLTKAQRETLSADALYFASSMFMLMTPGKGELTFRMVDSKPSPRSQAALDELVAAGVVSSEPFNKYGGVTYRPLVVFPRVGREPPGEWPMTVPISGRSALTQEGER